VSVSPTLEQASMIAVNDRTCLFDQKVETCETKPTNEARE
jgi:hypothetical protein